MRRLAHIVLMSWLYLAGAQAWSAMTEPFPELQAAQRAAWETVGILAHGMTGSDPRRFPGIHAWLKEYRSLGGSIGKPPQNAPLPKLDAERHVSRSPVFWRAYFEQAPGDAFTLLWHGALLLGGGEASRAAYVLLLARQARDTEKPILEAIDGLLDHSQLVVQRGAQRVAEAAKLHDEGNPAAAAARLRVLVEAWPANALAHYELALTAASRQYTDAGRKPPPRARLSIHTDLPPSAEVASAYARARAHDPLLIRAYQGNETPAGDVLLVLGKTVRPLWDIIARDTQAETRDETLWQLADALQDAGIVELSLTAGQALIGREGGYDHGDRKFIAENLKSLAPGAVAPVLKRLAQTPAQFIRFVLP
ncbi:MAG: hypothetical protein GEV05_14080 [Betaproteobacteria bacterium]|nr:hypothetical protein [Betaproteobacteria bacterium]